MTLTHDHARDAAALVAYPRGGSSSPWLTLVPRSAPPATVKREPRRSLVEVARALGVAVPEPDDDWQERAACRGMSPQVFFPERGDSGAVLDGARAVCATCPVTVHCLQAAFERRERFGVWGGKSWEQRDRMERKRRWGAAA